MVNEGFNSSPAKVALSVSDAASVDYRYTGGGLEVQYNNTGASLHLAANEKISYSNTVRLVIDPEAIDEDSYGTPLHVLQIAVQFSSTKNPGQYYKEIIDLAPHLLKLRPAYTSKQVDMKVMPYEVMAKQALDVIVCVRNGTIICSVDGMDYVHDTASGNKILKDLTVTDISLSSNSLFWNGTAKIILKKLQIGQDTIYQYQDGLHKTMTPWGHDFSLSMQLHADYSNPAQLYLLKQLADTYGVRGEIEAWVNVSDTNKMYGITTSQEYVDSLQALEDSGWDIGLHAVNSFSTNRTELLADLAIFEQTFGQTLKSWVDHGGVAQDIKEDGNDKSSQYYIADYLVENNVLIWVNDESHSHSQYDDLNYGGANYTHQNYSGLELFRTSNAGVGRLMSDWNANTSNPIDESDFDSRLRSYADERSVLVWHDYTISFLYVQDGGVNYAFTNLSYMGYPYANMTDAELAKGANLHPNGTWKIKMPVAYLFESMNDTYDVWYTTPSEIFNRSKLIQSVDLTEAINHVNVSNHNSQAVDGFTMYTKSQPTFYLTLGNVPYYAQRGAESWSFVIDSLPANASVTFAKVSLPPGPQKDVNSPLDILIIALVLAAVAICSIYALFFYRKRKVP